MGLAERRDLFSPVQGLDARDGRVLLGSESCHGGILDRWVGMDALPALLAEMESWRAAFTLPSFRNAIVLMVGWVLTHGSHAVTEALVTTDVARRRHHERYHRFFSRGTWSPDVVGGLLFRRILAWVGDGPVHITVDDTLTPKKGAHVFGIGSHLDPVRSTKRFRVFSFGHVWVVMSVVVRLPFSHRPWAIPVLFRIYRNKTECERHADPYRKKTELGRELVEIVARWAGQRRIHLAVDSAYCNATLMHELPSTVVVFGAMRPDAVLTALPGPSKPKPGRRRVRGRLLPKPEALAKNARVPWRTCRAELYGKRRTVRYKMVDAQWYRACGGRLVRIVVVRVDEGNLDVRVFLCTDVAAPVVSILETYAGRWAAEVAFRDLKQHLGFADSSARKRAAVERTAPFVGYVYTTLVLWFADGAWQSGVASPPIRPWYRHKRGASFADIVRAAQRTLAPLDVLDPARTIDNLRKSRRAAERTTTYRRNATDPGVRHVA